MGRRGPLPAREDAPLVVHPASLPGAPAPRVPGGLLPEVQAVWRAFWGSSAAQWVDRGSQLPRLVRWIRDVDAWHRVSRDLRGKRAAPGVFDQKRPWLGLGSTGQITRHPSAEELDKLDARIHRAEVEFGMTPYAAVRLGLAGAQGALTAEQLRRVVRERARDAVPVNAEWADGFRPE